MADAAAPVAEPRTYEYIAPIVLFGAFTMGESYLPPAWFPLAYLVKAVVVTAALFVLRGPLRDIRLDLKVIAPSVALGLLVFALWVGIDSFVPYPHLGERTAFDPTPLRESGWWAVFLGFRLYGLVLMVPLMEEIFWRSFLLRYLTSSDFRKLPVGTFSASALWIMVAASALAHPEWLVAIVASLAYALWLRKGGLFGAIVAHAVTNGALGAYVLTTGEYRYW